MNRNLRLGTLTATLLLVAAALYVSPRPAHAACVCDTESSPFITDCWGEGADCDAAVANLPSGCTMAANTACYDLGYDASCQVTYVQNSPYYCWYNPATGRWTVSGRVTFRCRICLPRCRNITIFLPGKTPYTCYCNDGELCIPDPGVPHCEGQYAQYCWMTAN